MLLPVTGAFGVGAAGAAGAEGECCSTNWRACSGSSWAWEPNWWNGSRKLLISMVKSFRWWSLSGDRQAVGDLSRSHRARSLCPMTINLRTHSWTTMGSRSGVPQRFLVSTGR